MTLWWILWKKSHHPGFPHCPHCVGQREEFLRHLTLYQCFRASQYEAATFSSIQFLFLAIRRKNIVCYHQEMTQALSQHISFKHFKKKKSCDLNISALVCFVLALHLTIYCCWRDQRGGVVFGVTVLQPEGLGSILLDSQNPPCWGALQQDMELLPAGMQLWGDAVGKMQPPGSWQSGLKHSESPGTNCFSFTQQTTTNHCSCFSAW